MHVAELRRPIQRQASMKGTTETWNSLHQVGRCSCHCFDYAEQIGSDEHEREGEYAPKPILDGLIIFDLSDESVKKGFDRIIVARNKPLMTLDRRLLRHSQVRSYGSLL